MGIFGHGNVTGIGQALEEQRGGVLSGVGQALEEQRAGVLSGVSQALEKQRGGVLSGVSQAVAEQPGGGLPFIQGHNEQGMVHAAVAYAKQNHRLRIYACTSSIGPGALNMVTAAATATVNRIPVLLLPGDIFACRQPDPVLQQLEVPHDYSISANDAFKPVSKYWDRILRPEQLMTAAMNAMRVLTDLVDTGAVTLALPQDVQTEAYDYPEEFFAKRVHVIERRPLSKQACEEACDLIAGKKRPLLICGGGVHYAEAYEALVKFAETFHVPIAETQAGKGAVVWNHPLNVGGVGVTGSAAANVLAKQADLIIAVGTRLADFTTASKTAFQNPDVDILSLNVARIDAMKMNATPLVADAREGLDALTEALQRRAYVADYAEGEIASLKRTWDAEVDRLYALEAAPGGLSDGATDGVSGGVSDGLRSGGPNGVLGGMSDGQSQGLTQTAAIGEINRFLDENAVIVAAAGGLPGDLHRLWRAKSVNSYHMEYGFSCMGYEIAGAFGVKLAEPEKEVYALLGDGSYIMLHSELLTSLQERRKITVLLFDNSGYQCIHNLQRSHGSSGFGNELRYRSAETGKLTGAYVPIDFRQLAQGLGAKGYRATTLVELREALSRARLDTVSSLIDIKVLPGTGTDGYESWWRVAVAEVSESDKVRAAFENSLEHLKQARQM
ncbi:3D-(3,5/4)-trihydroxycyclohexane-1,2-dione acylhydrolase (decyclizing) [Alicyclobacillus curvatus]|nr:3D-(3,5/4)-trihydroxycyclohexane-1,2-dione acylhydrolase (decyclizing) [Alicyclobacillus curvatus]